MIKHNLHTYAIAAILGGLTSHAGAQLLAYEGFDISATTLNGNSGTSSFGWDTGSTWSDDGGAASFNIISPGLQSPATGNTVAPGAIQGVANTTFNYRPLSSTLFPTVQTGDTYYFSVLAQRTTPNVTSQLDIQLGLGTGFYDILLNPNNTLQVGINTYSAPSTPIPTSPSNNPFFFVGQVTIGTIYGNGSADVTMNVSTPDNLDGPSTLSNRLSFTENTSSPVNLIGGGFFGFASDTTLEGWALDEIRIGRAIGDVYTPAQTQPVPEPATMAILALGAFGAIRKRRQQK
jgi:hypothetical protein